MFSVQPSTGVLVLGTPQPHQMEKCPLTSLKRSLVSARKRDSLMKNPPCVLFWLYSTPVGRNADKMAKTNLPSLIQRPPVTSCSVFKLTGNQMYQWIWSLFHEEIGCTNG
ncbi:hypothetical protein D3I10_01150 [Enterococcus faecalis]|nr:hypothetical protein [Enterococcus faecalis]